MKKNTTFPAAKKYSSQSQSSEKRRWGSALSLLFLRKKIFFFGGIFLTLAAQTNAQTQILFYLEKEAPGFEDFSNKKEKILLKPNFYKILDVGFDAKEKAFFLLSFPKDESLKQGYALVEGPEMLKNQKAFALVFSTLPTKDENLSAGEEIPIKKLKGWEGAFFSDFFPSFRFYKVEYKSFTTDKAWVEESQGAMIFEMSLERAKAAYERSKISHEANDLFLKTIQSEVKIGSTPEQVLARLGEPNHKTTKGKSTLWFYWLKVVTFSKNRVLSVQNRTLSPAVKP